MTKGLRQGLAGARMTRCYMDNGVKKVCGPQTSFVIHSSWWCDREHSVLVALSAPRVGRPSALKASQQYPVAFARKLSQLHRKSKRAGVAELLPASYIALKDAEQVPWHR